MLSRIKKQNSNLSVTSWNLIKETLYDDGGRVIILQTDQNSLETIETKYFADSENCTFKKINQYMKSQNVGIESLTIVDKKVSTGEGNNCVKFIIYVSSFI